MNVYQALRQLAISIGVTHLRAILNPFTAGVSVLCRNDAGEILLVRTRLTGNWGLPGGGIDRGETPVAAALRELHEETGHHGGTAPAFFGLYTRRIGLVTNLIAVYCVEGGEIAFRPSFEVVDAGWFPLAALPRPIGAGAWRRIAEWSGRASPSANW